MIERLFNARFGLRIVVERWRQLDARRYSRLRHFGQFCLIILNCLMFF